MADCIFCAIIAGDMSSRQVYADAEAVAFLDVAPLTDGHTLVVPRRHVDDLLTDPTVVSEMAPAISATAKLLVDRLGVDGLNLYQCSGAAAGQEVFHLHVHLVPRTAGDGVFSVAYRADPDNVAAVYARLKGG